jgi:hypothetical protein
VTATARQFPPGPSGNGHCCAVSQVGAYVFRDDLVKDGEYVDVAVAGDEAHDEEVMMIADSEVDKDSVGGLDERTSEQLARQWEGHS